MSDASGENLSIALRSNWLTVNNNTLRADVLKNSKSERTPVSPEELESVLLSGRRAILQGIEEFYEQQVINYPDRTVVRPSIWTAQLGTRTQTDVRNSRVFTEKGYANGGVNSSADEIQGRFLGHWRAVESAGFLPEVRRTTGGHDGGSWLLLRKPTLGQVLYHWFGYEKEAIKDAVEAVTDTDKETERRKLLSYRLRGEETVDRAPDLHRSRAQIALILSMGAIKSALGDQVGYEEEINDAFTYIDNDASIDVSTVRAIENSTFELR
jgi:hypothetical protein